MKLKKGVSIKTIWLSAMYWKMAVVLNILNTVGKLRIKLIEGSPWKFSVGVIVLEILLVPS